MPGVWLFRSGSTITDAPYYRNHDHYSTRYTMENAHIWAKSLYSQPHWIVASHFANIGIALNFLSTPVSYYLVVSLDADAATGE